MSEEANAILIVDDDETLLGALSQWLSLSGFETLPARSGEVAAAILRERTIDAVLTDMRMPGMSGLGLLEMITNVLPNMPVVLLTAYGDVPLAVEALKTGAFDFLTKPYDPERLVATLRNACTQHALKRKISVIEAQLSGLDCVASRIVGQSSSILRLQDEVRAVVNTPLDILLRGETGTGKEVVARTLHECSPRKNRPFVAINCAAVPSEIIESELFGHEPGAFTGAKSARVGRFEFANGGTIFLDEIESMPLVAQAKVLRVLQERVVERVGSNRVTPIDVRIISASKSDLREDAKQGTFREDLYYRIAGYEIYIPPLRHRGDDILLLFTRFAAACASRAGEKSPDLTPHIVAALLKHDWPGNVRELKSVAERFGFGLGLHFNCNEQDTLPHSTTLDSMLEHYERSLIHGALKQSGGSIAGAMEILDVPRRTLNEKMRRLGISRPQDQ